MSIIRRGYNSEYFRNPLTRQSYDSPRIRKCIDAVRGFKRTGKLLEIGFGNGAFLKAAKQFFTVAGVDISEHAVSKIDDSLNGRVSQFDVESSQPLPGRHDVIVAFNVLEHLERPGRVIQKAFEGLHRGGLLIGSVPLNAGVLGRMHTAITNLFDRTHVSTYPPDQWRQLFRQVGFRQLRFFGEVLIGSRISFHLESSCWRFLSFNLMFACEK